MKVSEPDDKRLRPHADTSSAQAEGFAWQRRCSPQRVPFMSDVHCRSCGMPGPHSDTAQCIQALEDEIRRLRNLLAVIHPQHPSGAADDDGHRTGAKCDVNRLKLKP